MDARHQSIFVHYITKNVRNAPKLNNSFLSKMNNLNNYFRLHICLSFRPSVRTSVRTSFRLPATFIMVLVGEGLREGESIRPSLFLNSGKPPKKKSLVRSPFLPPKSSLPPPSLRQSECAREGGRERVRSWRPSYVRSTKWRRSGERGGRGGVSAQRRGEKKGVTPRSLARSLATHFPSLPL